MGHRPRKARFYFVPGGGQFTQTDNSVVDESQMPANTRGIPGNAPKAKNLQ